MARKGGPARRGEQKMVITSRKHQRQIRPNRLFPAPPPSPFPHYKSLSPQQRRNIRPFVFLDLPGEIRNLIYTYLLEPYPQPQAGPVPRPGSKTWNINSGAVGCGRVLLMCDPQYISVIPMRAYGYGYPDLRIMQLCKAIKDEATKFFYEKHHFELFVGLGFENLIPNPPSTLRMDRIEDLRVLVIVSYYGGINVKTSLDLSLLLKATTSLRSLRIAVQMCGYAADDKVWSPWLTGLVTQIIDTTPSKYSITFTDWQGFEHSMCDSWIHPDWSDTTTDVDPKHLQKIAKKWGRE